MKKTLLFAAAALVMTVGCSKTETTPEVSGEAAGQIGFSTFVSTNYASRALVTTAKYPVEETFGTFAYFNTTAETFPTNAQVYIPESKVSNPTKATSGSVWKTDATYYWPKTGKLAFFSYSPYSINTSVTCAPGTGIVITDWDVDANQDVDVMVADPKLDQTANGSNDGYTGVPTIFRHKLAQVASMSIKTKNDYANGHVEATAQVGDKFFTVNKITINGIEYKGTFTEGNTAISTGSWASATGTKDYTFFDGNKAFSTTAVIVNENDDYLLVLPQEFGSTDEANIKVTYTIKTCTGTGTFFTETTTKEVLLRNQVTSGAAAWEMNKKYTYNFTVDLDSDIIYWAPSVENWVESGLDITI